MPFDRYLAAAFIDGGKTPRVLGRKLRRFSFWHRLLLLSVDSPLLRPDDEPAHLFDLRTAIGICRLGYRESRIRRPWVMPRRGLLLRGLVEFRDYAGDYLVRPEFNVIPPKPVKGMTPPGVRGHAPEIIRIVGDVIGYTGWEPKLVWEMPIGEAYWYQYLACRARGDDVDYLTSEEREFQRRELEREAAEAASRSATADSSAGEGDSEEEEE